MEFLDMAKGRRLVSGATGPIGTALAPKLRERGYEVVRLVRSPASAGKQIHWDPAQPVDPGSVAGFDAVIHLAGETIVGRWTEGKKRRIHESRAAGTRNLATALAKAAQKPQVLVSASAIGFYGSRRDQ